MKKKLVKRLIKNNKGTTMMETLVAFVVLAIILVALYRMIVFSSELRMRATDMNSMMQTFNKELYSSGALSKVEKIPYTTNNIKLPEKGEGRVKGPLFYIETDDGSELWVDDINAYGYTYKADDLVNNDHMMVPKALVFVHEKDDKTTP
ncbi:MAG: hypothetical protein K5865_10735 [Eubacterium sp.]|nr:hypothetical protein [Eubacterium sp.]